MCVAVVSVRAVGGVREAILVAWHDPPEKLAGYCLHALAAASTLPSAAAVRRLVQVTLTGLRAA